MQNNVTNIAPIPNETYQLPKSLNSSASLGEQIVLFRKQPSLRSSYSFPSVTAEYWMEANTPQDIAATTPSIHAGDNGFAFAHALPLRLRANIVLS